MSLPGTNFEINKYRRCVMNKFAALALLLGLFAVVGCEAKKAETPAVEPAATEPAPETTEPAPAE